MIDLPDMKERNTESQYWVFWPREAASKGIEKGMDFDSVKNWDNAFNLTVSYRRDSDIIRKGITYKTELVPFKSNRDSIIYLNFIVSHRSSG